MVQAQRTSSMRSALLLGNGFVVSSSAAIVSSSQTDPPSAQTSRTRTMHLHGSRFWSVSGSAWPIVENWKSRFRKRRLHDTSRDKEEFFLNGYGLPSFPSGVLPMWFEQGRFRSNGQAGLQQAYGALRRETHSTAWRWWICSHQENAPFMARVNHGVDMPETINDRLNAEPVGRVMCITSGA